MNGGDQVVIKNDISLAISTYLETENLELYDLNIAGNESISKYFEIAREMSFLITTRSPPFIKKVGFEPTIL